ncbi:MAG: hypothetical protein CBD01_007540 [Euryarchaeota archaeon TMED141]|nr:MAG: hypothetical protein CBD01_007540 [Euryarchaeota archaeon TMED141]
MQFGTAGGTNLWWVDGEFTDLLDRVACTHLTGVFANVVTGVDDDGKPSGVSRTALGVLLVMVDVHLVDATWSDAFGPDNVLDGAAGVRLHVGVHVKHTATLRFLGATVNALA